MASDGNSSNKSKWKYHVFLSFRGEDTRLGFTDHLYEALVRKSIITFRDDEELARGEVISPKLLEAIEQSLSAIVIISKNYASSTWCLEELQKILESKQKLGREVFPIFYGVDPSDVRYQRGSFAEAFDKHEEKFAENKEKVQNWRDALKAVANLSGWDSKNRREPELIEEIIAQVWTKLEPKFPIYTDGLVAIEAKVDNMYSLLRLGLEDVQFIGIWGMGGIGKTTLANVVFKRIKSQFDVSCFLPNIREASKEGDQGLVHLQNKLLSHLKLRSMVIETIDQGKDIIRNLLCNKKVLLVLDDVSAKNQLENLAANKKWFGLESRIIVTTRDKHLLISHDVPFETYEIEILNVDESLQLFCEKAFKGDQPKEGYLELSKSVVKYAGGLPLALVVLGSFLCRRSLQEWEDALDKIKQIPHDDILNKLKMSYDLLEDEHKTIFLDVACFFKGWFKDKVTKILHNCGLHPTIGINVLIERSLITWDGRVLEMHDLLEEMGKHIVLQESPKDLDRRNRLCSLEDIGQLLNKNMGSENVRGIVLSKSYEELSHSEAFSKMCNLKFLIILYGLGLPLGLNCLSSSLKVLIWMGYPLRALPTGVQLDELVHLQMCGSKIKKLWNESQSFRKLKVIDMRKSVELIQTPNVFGVPNLEELLLDGCENLVEVHESTGQHKKLAILSMKGCINLKVLPSKLEMSSLKALYLSGCSKVKRLPDFGQNMKCVSVLNLKCCKNLSCLPNTVSNLKSLKHLNISECSIICGLPDNINENKVLEDLDLSRTSIREVNPSLFCLENLKRLSFSGCCGPVCWDLPLPFGWKFSLESKGPTCLTLPSNISGLSSLTMLDLSYCNLSYELIPKDLGNLSSLERLNLSGNEDLVLPATSIANLSKLRCLELEGCKVLDRSVLPPHVHIYPDECVKEATSLNVRKLWKLFEPLDIDLFESNEDEELEQCPSYFQKPTILFLVMNDFFMRPDFAKFDLGVSITVDIPEECGSRGKWWGIAAFLALEPVDSPDLSHMKIYWNFESSHADASPSSHMSHVLQTAHSDRHLLIMLISEYYIYVVLHPRDHHICKSLLVAKQRKPEFSENTRLRFEVQLIWRKIKECRWHVLGKEDFK